MVRTRDLLIKIGAENSLPMSKIEEIVEKLESEWYSSSEHLHELTESDWKSLQIPTRLVNLIKKYLNDDPTCQDSLRQDSLSKLTSTLSPQELSLCLPALQQICFNLSAYTDAKYRTINLTNPSFQQKIGRFPPSLQYLKALGFVFFPTQISIANPDQGFFLSALENLNELAIKFNLPQKQAPEKFNPFKASFSTTNFLVSKVSEGRNDFEKISGEISQIKQNREKIVKNIRVNREAKVYRTGDDGNRFEESFKATDEDDDELIRRDVQNFIVQREKGMNFQNKRKNELEKLRSQEFCVKIGVRVRFPDGFVLEGNFSLKEKVRDIYGFVREFLEMQKQFYLFTTPPKVVVRECEELLEKYSPAVLFQFSWADDTKTDSYLRRRS